MEQHLIKPSETPAIPPYSTFVSAATIPTWVRGITTAIANGDDCNLGAENGISLTETGDLLLYRKVTPEDWTLFPMLLGVKEVWIEIRLYPTVV